MKAQQVLSLKIENETVVSRPFDFEAMCLMNDIHAQGKGKLSICANALGYMFEGTAVTDEVLARMELLELTALCNTLWGFYIDVLGRAAKNKNTKN